jgi:hypothetical protein
MTDFPWESNKQYIFWMRVCSLSYPSCKAHAPWYIAICGLSGCTTSSPHYLINGTILGRGGVGGVTEHKMCVLVFFTALSEAFLIIRRKSANYYHKVPDSSVGIATRYRLDGPVIESRWGRNFPHPSRPAWRDPPCILGTGCFHRVGVNRPVALHWPPTPSSVPKS